jgi:hypothetical protein
LRVPDGAEANIDSGDKRKDSQMRRSVVDLNSHVNHTHIVGNPADFPLTIVPAQFRNPMTGLIEEVPNRHVVTRADTGRALSVVSNRYALVPHTSVIETIDQALEGLDVGPVPRGIYVSGGGAKMRAIYKFPALERPLRVNAQDRKDDRLCPLIKVTNSLDATSKIAIEIGAFSFVCTNFAVGGSGIFAGGFMAVHSGTIKIEAAGNQLRNFLFLFDQILDLFSHWAGIPAGVEEHKRALDALPERYSERLLAKRSPRDSVFDVYNHATDLCTHQLRSASRALQLLSEVNRGFQNIDSWMPDGQVIEAEAVSAA